MIRDVMVRQKGYFSCQVTKSSKADHVSLFFPMQIRSRENFLNGKVSGLNKFLPNPIQQPELQNLRCEVHAPQLRKLRDLCNHPSHLRLHFYPQGKGTMGWHRDTGGDNAASYMKGSYAETGVGLLSSVRVDG